MKYFVLDRKDIKEEYWEKCEPSIITAMGSPCGQYTVLIFKEGNEPQELKDPMTQEQFESHCSSCNWPTMGK